MLKNDVSRLINLFLKNSTPENVESQMNILKQELEKLGKDNSLSEEDRKLAENSLKHLRSKTEN